MDSISAFPSGRVPGNYSTHARQEAQRQCPVSDLDRQAAYCATALQRENRRKLQLSVRLETSPLREPFERLRAVPERTGLM